MTIISSTKLGVRLHKALRKIAKIFLFISSSLLLCLLKILKSEARMEYHFPDALVDYNLLVTLGVKAVFQRKATCNNKRRRTYYRGG